MIIVGHRGARGLAPENTLASFEKAIEHHVDMLECDLRVTKDNQVILHHNSKLVSRDGQKFPIIDYTYAELHKLKPDLTLLKNLLNSYPDAYFYLEIKPKVDITPIVEYLQKNTPNNYMIGSKSFKTLKKVHLKMPSPELIVIHPWSGIIASYRARRLGTKNVAFNKICLWSGFIKSAARSGYKIFTYSLNDPKKAKKWEKAGLYGVITDYPDLFDKKYN